MPIIIAGISEAIVEITDTIFLAHYGVTELAAIGMADAFYSLALFLSLGLVDGIQIIIGQLGEEVLASANIIFSCYALFLIPVESFSATVCSTVSNLIGQKQRQELTLLIQRTIKLSYLVVIPLLLATLIFPELVLAIFTSDVAMIEASLLGLLVIVLAALMAVPGETLYSAVAGTGDTRVILAIQVIVTTITVAFAGYAALWLELTLEYILLAEVFGWLTCLILSWIWFQGGLWKRLEI